MQFLFDRIRNPRRTAKRGKRRAKQGLHRVRTQGETLESRKMMTCDLDLNGIVDAKDIDHFYSPAANLETLDIDNDGRVTAHDRSVFVEVALDTRFGDSNLDGEFNSADIVAVFQAGEYEDDAAENSTWETGDWNGDGDFDSGDLVETFQRGQFEKGPWKTVAEPGNEMHSASDLGILLEEVVIEQAFGIDTECNADPVDFYKFELPFAASVSVTLEDRNDGGQIHLLTDKNRNGIFETSVESFESDGNSGTTNRRVAEDLVPGTYYVSAGQWVASDASRYTLTITPEALPALSPDPGDTVATAMDLGILDSQVVLQDVFTAGVDSVDLYRFEVTTPTAVLASMSGRTSGGAIELFADKNGDGILESVESFESDGNSGDNNRSVEEDLTPGVYYVQAERWSETDASRYRLTLTPTVLPSLTPDPGETLATAMDLGVLNTRVTLQDAYTGGVDSVDYFKFEVTTPTAVLVTLSGRTSGGGVNLLADKNGDGIFQSSTESFERDENSGMTNRSVEEDLVPGTYYVWVGGWSESDASRYTLTLTPEQLPSLTPDPGDTLATATDLGQLDSQIMVEDVFTAGIDSVDYYRFEVTSPTAVLVSISGRTSGGEISLLADKNGDGIFQPSAESFESDSDSGANDRAVSEDLAPGIYYVRVGRWSESDASRYKLTLTPEVLPSQSPDPGDTLATAMDLGVLESQRILEDVFTAGVDSFDYYRFELTTPTTVAAALTGRTSGGSLYLLSDKNEDGEFEPADESYASKEDSGRNDFNVQRELLAGIYFIRVGRRSESDASRYTLTLTPTQP